MKVVQQMFQQLYDQGDIYKGSYDGWYCIKDESFLLSLISLTASVPTVASKCSTSLK